MRSSNAVFACCHYIGLHTYEGGGRGQGRVTTWGAGRGTSGRTGRDFVATDRRRLSRSSENLISGARLRRLRRLKDNVIDDGY